MVHAADGTAEGTVFGSTSLDPSETNGKSLGLLTRRTPPPRYSSNPAQAAYHARYQRTREHILDALDGSTFGPIGRQRTKIANCCLAPLLCLTDAGRVTVAPGVCRQRMCPTCQARRGRELTNRVAAITALFNAPRLVTLTLAASTDSLKHQLDRLYAWFRELRRSPLWKDHVVAAVAVAEVTRNAETGLWHPHLHILTDGTYLPQNALAAEWERVTNGSRIVDIRAVHDRRNAAQYVAAYVAKPTQVDGWPPAAVNEFAYALRGRRMLITAGKAHRCHVPEDECETRPAIVEPLCSLPRLLRADRDGCPVAAHALSLLRRAGGVPAAAMGAPARGPKLALPPLDDWEHEWLAEALRFVGTDGNAPTDDSCPFHLHDPILSGPPGYRPNTHPERIDNLATARIDHHAAA